MITDPVTGKIYWLHIFRVYPKDYVQPPPPDSILPVKLEKIGKLKAVVTMPYIYKGAVKYMQNDVLTKELFDTREIAQEKAVEYYLKKIFEEAERILATRTVTPAAEKWEMIARTDPDVPKLPPPVRCIPVEILETVDESRTRIHEPFMYGREVRTCRPRVVHNIRLFDTREAVTEYAVGLYLEKIFFKLEKINALTPELFGEEGGEA